jgi:hypothetical protein
MPTWCPSCGELVEVDMRYCPNCGKEVGFTAVGRPAAAFQVPTQPTAMPPYASPFPAGPYPGGAYPPFPFPLPYFYRPPMTAKRGATIAGGIIMLIDGILAFFLALIMLFTFELWPSVLLFAGFTLALVGAVAAFQCAAIHMTVVGPLVLIGAGLSVMTVDEFLVIIGTIGIALAALALGLLVYGWSDMRMRMELKRSPQMMAMRSFLPGGAEPPQPYGGARTDPGPYRRG